MVNVISPGCWACHDRTARTTPPSALILTGRLQRAGGVTNPVA
jgi:hypothetical protein